MKTKMVGLVFLLLVLVTAAFAQEGYVTDDSSQAYAIGQQDAKADISSAMWMGIGCATGGFSWLYPEIFPSNAVPQTKIVGKSQTYVAGYTDGYAQSRKKIMQKNSCIGGAAYWACCVAYYVVAIAAATEEATAY